MLKIKEIEEQDLSTRVGFLNSSSVSKGIFIDLPVELGKSIEWLNAIKNDSSRKDFTLKNCENEIVGFMGLVNCNHKHKTAELYIFLGPDFQSNGYGRKALSLLMDFAFSELGLRKVSAYVSGSNIDAARFYLNFGFSQEGCLKQHCWFRGSFVDRLIFSIFLEDANKLDFYGGLR